MKDRNDDLRDELKAHLEMATRDRIERGEDASAAAVAARRELGNISQIQEATRDAWGHRWLERAAQDVRYALRLFRRNPGFALVAILSLTLGIGANTALFQVVNAVRLQSLPVADPSTLVEVRLVDMDGARGNFQTWYPAVTYPIWQALAARQQAFSGLFAWGGETFSLSNGGEVRTARGLWVTGELFRTLGIHPAAGRLLTPDDDLPGCPARAVLSHGFWQRAYGGNPAVVGQPLTLNSRAVEIVGVAPASFHGLDVGKTFDVAIPVCADPVLSDDGQAWPLRGGTAGRLEMGTVWWLSVFGRLSPGWTAERASAHLAAISPELFKASLPPTYPTESVQKYLDFKLAMYPGGAGLSELREAYTSPLWMLLGIAALVLLIACANLANLLLARATARQREIAARLAMGASRGRLIRQLLTESLLLAVIGGVSATLLAGVLSRAFVALLDTGGSTVLALGVDWRVLAFTTGLSLLTCLLFGLAPAMDATRVSASSVMRASARDSTAGREVVSLRRGLVVAQVALSVVLLFGSLLFAASLRNLVTTDPGFNADGVVTAAINFSRLNLPVERRAAFRREVLDRLRALPSVQAAATTRIIPASGNSAGNTAWPEGDQSRQFDPRLNWVGTGYFTALGMPFVAGRDFTDADTLESTPVAIVNETFASKIAGSGRTVVGRRFTQEATPSSPVKTFEIVGVVRNAMYADPKEGVIPVAFLSDAQRHPSASMQVVMRSALPAATITPAVTRVLADIDPRIGVAYGVLSTAIRDTVGRERLLATLSGGFGVLAAILTLVGLYGLIAYTVTRRTNEIGIRMALGAGRTAIARLILRETSVLLAIGAAVGVVLALAGGRAASTLLFGVRPYDPLALLLSLSGLAVIAFIASYAPARRAMRIEPVTALRAD
jgi:putative ABC transport system permease protein